MHFYKSVVKVIDEKPKNIEFLVKTDSIYSAETTIHRHYDGTNVEFETISISKTKIVDVIDNTGDKIYKLILKSKTEDEKEFKTEHVTRAFDITDAKDKSMAYGGENVTIHSITETKILEII